jgi:hypothetical protein
MIREQPDELLPDHPGGAENPDFDPFRWRRGRVHVTQTKKPAGLEHQAGGFVGSV